jgi:hypothetical protein
MHYSDIHLVAAIKWTPSSTYNLTEHYTEVCSKYVSCQDVPGKDQLPWHIYHIFISPASTPRQIGKYHNSIWNRTLPFPLITFSFHHL